MYTQLGAQGWALHCNTIKSSIWACLGGAGGCKYTQVLLSPETRTKGSRIWCFLGIWEVLHLQPPLPRGLNKAYANRPLTLSNTQDPPAWISMTISGKTRTNPHLATKLLLVSRERQARPVWWPKKPSDYLLQLLQLTAGVHHPLAQHLHSSSSQPVVPYMQFCQGWLGTEDRAQGLAAGACQVAVLQPAGERQQGWGKHTPGITEALLR